jgi:hypothetical protein
MRSPLPPGSMIALVSFQRSSGTPCSTCQACHAAVGSGGPCSWQPSWLASADPPCPGHVRLYGSTRVDHGGEVNHATLIARLAVYDGGISAWLNWAHM